MLSKRTNILFTGAMWKNLQTLSREKAVSVGELIRDAVDDVYFSHTFDEQKSQAYKRIQHIRPARRGKVDYKSLINAGRKR